MGNPSERYLRLGLRQSFPKSYQYVLACEELVFILKNAYKELPKATQSLIFQDILLAFRLLPEMQSQRAVSAANLLAQSADTALQKQKRVLVAAEFKHAKIYLKRRSKAQVEGSVQLPQDVLMHIFSFLDMRSLVSAAHVCWLWNSVASDKHLWQSQYNNFFGNPDNLSSAKGAPSHIFSDNKKIVPKNVDSDGIDWRKAFIGAYTGSSSKILSSSRGYCGHCHAIVWLSNVRCSNEHFGLTPENQQIKAMTNRQIVDYLFNGSWSTLSSSDSDSDSDGAPGLKLWTYPRSIQVSHMVSFWQN